MLKTCSTCNQEKPLDAFYKHPTKPGERRGQCKECAGTRQTLRRAEPSGRAVRRTWYEAWYQKNREIVSVKKRAYRSTPQGQAAERRGRERKKKNIKCILYNRVHRAWSRAGQQCPPWMDRDAFYPTYQTCPKGHHVDHIVPLNGPVVQEECADGIRRVFREYMGLHVPWNLQHLTAKENLQKQNRLKEDEGVNVELLNLLNVTLPR